VDGPTVVVPLLLSPGYHSRVDIPGALAQRRPDALLGAVLGPDAALNEVLLKRLQQAGWRAGEAVVLAAAGSSDPAGATATETQAQLLTEKTRGPVLAGYASAAAPDVPTAVAALRAAGAKRVAVATYLLAPGFFAGSVADSGADLVSEPLGPHDAIARLVLRRYDHALSAASTTV
jgi:sirohydrochlorin ferrochelatase